MEAVVTFRSYRDLPGACSGAGSPLAPVVAAEQSGLAWNLAAMSGLLCPFCGREIELFKKGGGEALARTYALEFLGAVPLDPAAVVAGDVGRPVVRLNGDSPAKRAFGALAEAVAAACRSSLEAAATLRP